MGTVISAGALVALILGAVAIGYTTLVLADSASVLLVVEDDGPGERRADSVVLATWWRGCDDITLTSIPRDLVVSPGSEPLAVLYQTSGVRAMAAAVEDLVGLRIGAVVTIDLDEVVTITEAIGPVSIDLPTESLDRRTGFHAGPGSVEVAGASAVTYLRSRTWEERIGDDWVLVESSDLDRISRAQTYVAAALRAVQDAGFSRRARLVEDVLWNAAVDIVDPLRLAGFIVGAWSHDRTVLETLPVEPERTTDERRSPFAPGDLDATNRLVLAGVSSGAIVGCRPGG